MPELITDEYRKQNATLHEINPHYGTTGHNHAKPIAELAAAMGVNELLDYGCGKQTLGQSLPHIAVDGYDPCIPGLETPPIPHDLVVATDILEHIEPDLLDNVLDHLKQLTQKAIYLEVSTVPAQKTLPDGRNAHICLHDTDWWLDKLMPLFSLDHFARADAGFVAIMSSRRMQ